jgi:hypothetical protein
MELYTRYKGLPYLKCYFESPSNGLNMKLKLSDIDPKIPTL